VPIDYKRHRSVATNFSKKASKQIPLEWTDIEAISTGKGEEIVERQCHETFESTFDGSGSTARSIIDFKIRTCANLRKKSLSKPVFYLPIKLDKAFG
jgi:hypothetical protein